MIELRGPNTHHTLQSEQKKKGLTCITTECSRKSACETEKVCSRYQSQIHPAISRDRGGTACIVRIILAKYGILRQAY